MYQYWIKLVNITQYGQNSLVFENLIKAEAELIC